MIIHMIIVWYDINYETRDPFYSKQHSVTVVGETPRECMEKFYELEKTHDLSKFSRMQIAGIY